MQSLPLLSANYSSSQAASHSSPSTGSKWPICQAGQLQLNRAGARGAQHAHLGLQREKACSWQLTGLCSQGASSTGYKGDLSPTMTWVPSEPWQPRYQLPPMQGQAQLCAAAGKPSSICMSFRKHLVTGGPPVCLKVCFYLKRHQLGSDCVLSSVLGSVESES